MTSPSSNRHTSAAGISRPYPDRITPADARRRVARSGTAPTTSFPGRHSRVVSLGYAAIGSRRWTAPTRPPP
jgi:hypothetical protein